MTKPPQEKPRWQRELDRKHADQIAFHEKAYGAKLGEALAPPTKARLDKDFKERQAKGELFSQTTLGRQIMSGKA